MVGGGRAGYMLRWIIENDLALDRANVTQRANQRAQLEGRYAETPKAMTI